MIKREKPGENLHVGHRERMRRKFLNYGHEVFETYELLEMLLFAPIKCKDTNPIAKRLVFKFGTLENIFSATPEELCSVDGVGAKVAEFLINVGTLKHLLCRKYRSSDVQTCDSYETAGKIALEHFRGVSGYRVAMIMLDNTLRVIGITDICDADYESAAVKPNHFIDIAIRSRAAAVVLAHNHPYGPLVPSPGDIETNRLMVHTLSEAGIFCIEHYIISGERFVGIMNKPGGSFYQCPGLREFLNDRFDMSSCFTVEKESSALNEEYDDGSLFSTLSKIFSTCTGKESAEDITHRLLNRYQNLPNALSVSEGDLVDLLGMNPGMASFTKILAAVLSRSTTDLFKKGTVYTETEIREYFKHLFLGATVERIYMMSFDSKGAAINVHFLSEGTINSAGVRPRKILETIISDEAKFAVIAHNHPTGIAKSSDDDYQTTAHIASALNLAGVELLAHYVVAGNDCEILKLKFERSSGL